MRQQQPFQITSRFMLKLLAVGAVIGSAFWWWGIQSTLTENKFVAAAYTAILVLAPPTLLQFVIPTTPAGMLLQRINGRTIGLPVVIFCSIYLLFYEWNIIGSWWAAQPIVAQANLITQQTIIAIIGFTVIPALLIAPVTSDELVEQMKQAYLVKRYELQTQAEIGIQRRILLRATQLSMKGLANLTDRERQELVYAVQGNIANIDRTMREIHETIDVVGGVKLEQKLLADDEYIQQTVEYFGDMLFLPEPEPEPQPTNGWIRNMDMYKQQQKDEDLLRGLLNREKQKQLRTGAKK